MGAESWRSESKVLHNEAGRVKQQETVAGETAQGSRKTRRVTEDTRNLEADSRTHGDGSRESLSSAPSGSCVASLYFQFQKVLKKIK